MPTHVADEFFEVADFGVQRRQKFERRRFALDKTPKCTKFIGHLVDKGVGGRWSWFKTGSGFRTTDAKRVGRSGREEAESWSEQ